MKAHKAHYSIMIVAVVISGCGFQSAKYKEAVKDGFTKFPQACEIEHLLGEADHFISYSGPNVKQVWSTDVFFANRYELTMQAEVKVNSDFSRIAEVIGEPKFYLAEITSVDIDPDGRAIASMEGQKAVFGPKEWNEIVKSKGDFSIVGVKIKKDQPVPNFEKYVEATRRPRIQIRPDCGAK